MAPPLDYRNVNLLWSSVLAETLSRCGVRQAAISPGSRSAPLVLALAAHAAIEAVPVLDERSAGFFALGLAKRSGRPVAVVCTSGTAAANLYPAVVEAHESGVPLVILTADRPPELRACASGQTIDQQKLYGDYVVFHHEFALPEAALPLLRYLRQTAAHACAQSCAPLRPGPVHLNVPFRDPLVPGGERLSGGGRGGLGGLDGLSGLSEEFFSHLSTQGLYFARPGGRQVVRAGGGRGVVVAGPGVAGEGAAVAGEVARLAAGLGWPVLADALSPARHHELPGVVRVSAYDAILRNAARAAALRPDRVLCLGGWPTSKILRAWIDESNATVHLVAIGGNRDSLHGRTRWVPAALADMQVDGVAEPDPEWLAAWTDAEKAARGVLDGALEGTTELFEPKAAWILSRVLPEGTPVHVASSMPVRDVEYFWPPGNRRHVFSYNRGANGIDGTLSTALGVAHGGPPAVLLTGDLALLHDTNGFLLAPLFRGSLTIVLINNNGGGIFEHLPVARLDPPFEEFFATPQEVDFGRLVQAYRAAHVLVRDWDHFGALVADLPAQGIRVLEIRTDRKRDAARRREIFAASSA